MIRLCLSLLAAIVTAAAATPGPVPRLPVSAFFKKPALSQLSFSPDGKRLAYLVPYERRLNLVVLDLEKGTKNLLTNFTDREIASFLWANDDRLLFQIDRDGEEAPGLYAVNRDGTNPVVLASGGREGTTGTINDRFGGLLRRLENDPRHILVLVYKTSLERPDVGRMNLGTGTITVVTPSREGISSWILDRQNQVRIGLANEDGRSRILHRAAGSQGDWQELFAAGSDDPGWTPLGFDGDNRTLYVATNLARDRFVVCKYDTVARTMSAPLCEDPVYDVGYNNSAQVLCTLHYSQHLKRVVGLSYEADHLKNVFWDESYARRQQLVDRALPDTVNRLVQGSADGKRFVYLAYSDRDPGVYYLLDEEKKRLDELAVVQPGLDPEQMAPMKPVAFKARDNLVIHGYLTLPVGVPPRNLPLVVNPHGGPYTIRDTWKFNPEVQLLANRGFAVIQVDYRGSGGYGPAFERIGWKKWGLEMQNDLTDAVHWLVDEGIADPARVVICGASYGGYATMAGLAFTPELYCAGVNYVGATDISLLIPKAVKPDRLRWINTRIADLSDPADRARIRATSPVNFAERIRAPVLMAYGKNDPRVVMDHGWDMERALKAAGKEFKMIIETDEGHGFRKEERSIAFYTEVDEFLDRHVPRDHARVVVKPAQVIDLPAKAKN
ncbi:MAG: S9 family peptidase [Verrucomicrobia bacterium]|nr:S9 family peptidase [Verrucomicrobiota bacterium]